MRAIAAIFVFVVLASVLGSASAGDPVAVPVNAAQCVGLGLERNTIPAYAACTGATRIAYKASQSMPREVAKRCCKVCRKGKACGNSCIARWKNCHKAPGCACDG